MVWIRSHGEKEIIYNIFKKNVSDNCCCFLLTVVTGYPKPQKYHTSSPNLKNRDLGPILTKKKGP